MKRYLSFLLAFVIGMSLAITAQAVDLSITAASVLPSTNAVVKTGTAGGTITAGQTLYADASDGGDLKLADADASALTAVVVGIALHGASDGQPLSFLASGDITIGATVVVGEIYVLSGTAGGIAPEADLATADWVSVLGVGITTGKIRIQRANSGVQIP